MAPFPLKSFIPPQVANPTALNAFPSSARMGRIVDFYSRLPHGPAPKKSSNSFFSWYYKKYLGKNASGAPLLHLVGAVLVFSYASEYYYHIRHHEEH
ncbi:ATP synthase subunit f, mitochondrial [Schizosaccharomyces pombe]|uniref:ATP synthase subunit f, mitochondrial n=1 Tax=Schizosaccharomyces pombe (strain 972 / ATCC 24843) TaxID=284812 RepID=ATPK_SCHPO|nr:putative F0-ATPase subunit F [Schizosaccharomyces pombe]O94377.1 RecName: Full=ATP synthase subunit f, mitochondrial; Flags: Precursor [Schizosaccharomyces pombe 972h-]CAA22344.1 F0-ATPase subunit F (predicted) [Schizosaccharomyces pombe]|eukprot:NP_596629.1 putative F0-ATPase subunit F [Schizosaccharomyces pombe]